MPNYVKPADSSPFRADCPYCGELLTYAWENNGGDGEFDPPMMEVCSVVCESCLTTLDRLDMVDM